MNCSQSRVVVYILRKLAVVISFLFYKLKSDVLSRNEDKQEKKGRETIKFLSQINTSSVLTTNLNAVSIVETDDC